MFVTGFSGTRYPAEQNNQILFNVRASITTPPVVSTDALTDGIQVTLVDDRTGAVFYQKVQLSLVFVGLREFGTSYPSQALYMDDFKLVNTISTIAINTIIASGAPLAGTAGGNQIHNG